MYLIVNRHKHKRRQKQVPVYETGLTRAMIRNHRITYDSSLPFIYTWRPESDFLFAISVAVITTVLAYQTTGIVFDLLLGIKKKGVTCARDIQLLLLIQAVSLRPLIRSLFLPTDNIPSLTKSTMENCERKTFLSKPQLRGTLAPRFLFRLIVGLLVAPIVSAIAIVLSLERDTDLTFAEAKFGGLAVGIAAAGEHTWDKVSNFAIASRPCFSTTAYDRSSTDFTIWLENVVKFSHVKVQKSLFEEGRDNLILGMSNETAMVEVFAHDWNYSASHIYYRVVTSSGSMTSSSSGTYKKGPGIHSPFKFIKLEISQSDVDRLADFGAELLEAHCGYDSSLRERASGIELYRYQYSAARIVPCKKTGAGDGALVHYEDIINEMAKRVTFVNSPNITLLDTTEEGHRENVPDDVVLLTRRQSYVSFILMLILTIVIVFLRVVVAMLTNNDVARCLGLIVRETFGIPWGDSMLPHKDMHISYGKDEEFIEIWRTGNYGGAEQTMVRLT